jgi:hypothetical protein
VPQPGPTRAVALPPSAGSRGEQCPRPMDARYGSRRAGRKEESIDLSCNPYENIPGFSASEFSLSNSSRQGSTAR